MQKLILLSLMLCAGYAFCATEHAPHVKVSLLLPQDIRAGDENIVVVRMAHAKGWHTYGPAEVGATTINWSLPPGWSVGEIQWPNEENFDLQGVSSWGYSGTVELRVPLIPARNAKGNYLVKATVGWVVCGEGMCIPGDKEFSLDINIGGQSTVKAGTVQPSTGITTKDSSVGSASQVSGKDHKDNLKNESDVTPQKADLQQSSATTLDWKIILAAFAGGMILNLMPCVFPILGVKILSFIKHAGGDRRGVVLEAGAYGLGILVSAVALGVAIVALRGAGTAVGWGFQLQDARVVWVTIVVLGLFAMNMADGWTLPSLAGGAAAKAGSVGGWLGAFLSGALMVAVATPCSAPFLAIAIGGVFTLPALQAVGVMAIMGLGLAAPYWLLSLWPGAVKVLPKPGEWMENLKKILAWVMGAAALFEAWVYVGQVSPDESLRGLMGILILFMGVWSIAKWHRWGRVFGIVLVMISVWMSVMSQKAEIAWESWTPERVAQLRREGREIVVDFTARWCVNCLVNEKVVWGNKEILDLVKDKKIALLKADWTKRDETIAAELKRRGRAAVPLLVIYKGPEPKDGLELPNLLTVGQVEEAIK